MLQKIRQKSSAYWKHGKHKGRLVIALTKNRAGPQRPTPRMYETVKEVFAKESFKGRRPR